MLSFAASAALCRVTRPESAAGGAQAALRATLNATAAAAAATAPIAAWHMGGAAPLALPMNAIFVPWTGLVLLPAALLATLAAALPTVPGADLALVVAERLAACTLGVAEALGAWVPSRPATTPASAWLALAALLSFATVMARRTARKATPGRAAPCRIRKRADRAVCFTRPGSIKPGEDENQGATISTTHFRRLKRLPQQRLLDGG